ncbi:MAG: hypothetical protein QOE03_1856 [Micromonosporaceae bacterium]|nr:hypothetical protein [Micromonosporaceae bacterium]
MRQATTVSRRALLLAGVGAGATTVLAGGAATLVGAGRAEARPLAGPRAGAMTFLDLMMDAHPDGGDLRLPQSYSDQVGLYATGFTYDAALAILAYLADDRDTSEARAHRLGEALYYAQQHDPGYSDGRLRQAYNVGPYTRAGVEQPDGLVRPDGTVNIGGAYGFIGSGTGEHAWAGLALCALHQRTGDGRMVGAAVRIADWIGRVCRSDGPLGGFTDGVDRAGQPLRGVGTAHNADLVAFFGQLAAVTGDQGWLGQRDAAARFVTAMWDPRDQIFHSGTADGRTVDRAFTVLDAQTHSWLALRDLDHVGCLDTVDRKLTVTDTAVRPNSTLVGAQTVTGVTLSSGSRTADPQTPIEPGLPRPDLDAVWLEGTAQYAAALRHSPLGALDTGTRLSALTAAQADLGVGQTVADRRLPDDAGLIAASSPVHVGYVRSGYFPARHVAATAWYVLAAAGVNPLAA